MLSRFSPERQIDSADHLLSVFYAPQAVSSATCSELARGEDGVQFPHGLSCGGPERPGVTYSFADFVELAWLSKCREKARYCSGVRIMTN